MKKPTTPVRCPGCFTLLRVPDDVSPDGAIETHTTRSCTRPDPVIVARTSGKPKKAEK